MALKGNEKIVAKVLKKHFGVSSCIEVVKDPPDIIMSIDGQSISIEITDLDENSLQGRRTNDSGYIRFINKLNKDMGSLIPSGIRIIINFYHFNNKVSIIDRNFRKYLMEFLSSNKIKIGSIYEDSIDKIFFKISVLKSNGKKAIAGSTSPFGIFHKKSKDINYVANQLGHFNLELNSFNILSERIHTKSEKCKNLNSPVWLALYDNYYNKFCDFSSDEHIEHYKNVKDEITDFGIFKKVFIIFQNEDVLEIT